MTLTTSPSTCRSQMCCRPVRRPAILAVPLHLGRQGGFRPRPVKQTAAFTTGQTLDVPGAPQVIPLPGHTKGSTAFLVSAHGFICTGDALVTADGITGRTGPRVVARAFTEDSLAALGSLATLRRYDTSLVLPGHGLPWTGGVCAAVDSARRPALASPAARLPRPKTRFREIPDARSRWVGVREQASREDRTCARATDADPAGVKRRSLRGAFWGQNAACGG